MVILLLVSLKKDTPTCTHKRKGCGAMENGSFIRGHLLAFIH